MLKCIIIVSKTSVFAFCFILKIVHFIFVTCWSWYFINESLDRKKVERKRDEVTYNRCEAIKEFIGSGLVTDMLRNNGAEMKKATI